MTIHAALQKFLTSIFSFALFLISDSLFAQPGTQWDNTRDKDWPDAFTEVEIISGVDGKAQKAFFYGAKKKAQPLIISLHTWSGDYRQKDPLISQILEKDWNYIHPDFRGPNWTQEACGSQLVVSDIDDAIDFALKSGNVDPTNIHIIGVSGGGFATMLAYMKSRHNIRTFSAWCGISDINAWYHETKARQLNYARHISLATTRDSVGIDIESAKQRSPLLMDTPVNKRIGSKLFIYAGVHDGYTGSVPITHSLLFYNKVIRDIDPSVAEALISDQVIDKLTVSRSLPEKAYGKLSDRKIHYQTSFNDQVYISVFEGGHEMLSGMALDHIPGETILAIGDSNGQMNGGWVDQLKAIRSKDFIINESISGNTIGFVNNGNPALNTVMNVEKYISRHDPKKGNLDKIIVLLGTNDCKAVFKDRMNEVPENYQDLINKIRSYYQDGFVPEIIIVSAPPYGPDEILLDKYKGAGKRVKILNAQLKTLAKKNELRFIDVYSPLVDVFPHLSKDGVHLSAAGHRIMAEMISEKL
ncbi:MAG: prolyl oligopeptidase family serine peptidase [Cyclobacteriaceae bacterium]|nr:prolyl oligopeptidase family serine peptidase [Cyclobacteriaceae bacterium SS2]